jgi:4-amino-4-deoxy-L-arabinose transferase-like glycosyltransferase
MQAQANSEPPALALPSRRSVSLPAVLFLFASAAAAVNPLRETPIEDDWAYAETVKHFLETGQYRLNDWLSANIAFQTLWATLFCLPGGFSFAALRVSTIVLALIGLAAFRGLALEHGLSRVAANLLTLCIASSALFFKMSLTFMSDVPFVAVMTVALWLYTRAFHKSSWFAWCAASVAGAAAVLTRQFGVALLGAAGVVWLADRQRFARLPRYLMGIALPIAATFWQLDRGWNHSNWAAAHNLNRQRLYLFGTGFFKNLPWRPLVIAEYLAWFLMPLVLVVGIAVLTVLRRSENPPRSAFRGSIPRLTLELLGWTAVFFGGVFYGIYVIGVPGLMPFLSWNFELLYLLGTKFRILATVIAVGGGILFAFALVRRYLVADCRPLNLHLWFLDATTFFSLSLALVFFLIGDEYLLIFMPFAAIALGRVVEPVLVAWRRTVLILCFVLLAGAAIWTREGLCRNEAIWTLAERLHARGVPTGEIFAGWEWAGYYHFDDFVRSSPPTATTTFADFFERWTAERRTKALYLIVHDPQPPAGQQWETVDRFQYFSVFSRGTETFFAVRRVSK